MKSGDPTLVIPGMAAATLALALAAFALACGSGEPEARLERAGARLEQAREELAAARERRGEARAELREARRDFRQAERKVMSAEELLARRASDVALFRAVQSALLEDPALRKVAVGVRVEDATVTLEGEVTKPSARERAVALARGTPGVEQVRDEIEVLDGASAEG